MPTDAAYFHARFQRVNPLPCKEVYTIVADVVGQGHYVGAYMARSVNNTGWWREGAIKFYLDGDEYPTIRGTGTEDYFCGSCNFENRTTKQVESFNSPYAGLHQIIRPDGAYQSQMRFGIYRRHLRVRCVSTGICASSSMCSGSAAGYVISPSRTTSLRSPIGIKLCPRSRSLPDSDYLAAI